MASYDDYKLDNGEPIGFNQALADACYAIEHDWTIVRACSHAEVRCGCTFDSDFPSVRIDDHQLGVSCNIGLEVFVGPEDPQRESLQEIARAVRALADSLDQHLEQPVDVRAIQEHYYQQDTTSPFLGYYFLAVTLAIFTLLAWRVW